jgi:hypothetical protein
MEIIVFSRSDCPLCRVLPASGNPEREARRLSYGHPFTVQVAARVPDVDEGALREALSAAEVGAGWYRLPLATVLEAVARATREPRGRKRAEREASEELGAWQRWLEPCRSSLAPRATVVKAALRERGAPPWLLQLCREVSIKDTSGHYRKILKIGSQTVQASDRAPAPAVSE